MKKLSPSDLTLAEAERIERDLDVPWMEIATLRSIHYVKAIASSIMLREHTAAEVEAEWQTVTLGDLRAAISPDDLPESFEDGAPRDGGRAIDSYITAFAFPPFCWPPDVVRRQSFRDLHLLMAAAESLPGAS